MKPAAMHSNNADMDTGSVVAIVGGVATVVTAFLAGLWQWLSGRKKAELETSTALVAGFVSLLTAVQAERDRLLTRIAECELQNQRQDRRIAKLEGILARNQIEIPGDDL